MDQEGSSPSATRHKSTTKSKRTNPWLTFFAGALATVAGALVVGVLGADTQDRTIFASLARFISGTQISDVSVDVNGSLCTADGASTVVRLSGFTPGEEVQIWYFFVPQDEYYGQYEPLQIGSDGTAVGETMSWVYSPEECPEDSFYPLDVHVYRSAATKSTRAWILFEAALPTRNR